MVENPATISLEQSLVRKLPGDLIRGHGELADRTREFDWERTPVGAIDRWPEVLLNTVNLILAHSIPCSFGGVKD